MQTFRQLHWHWNRHKTEKRDTSKQYEKLHKHTHLSISTKVRHFNCFQSSIFLYNCSLWSLTPTLIKAIDSFHRKQLRYAIGICYPKKISNIDLYKLTNEKPWSEVIVSRRLKLLGHICRLHEETPARQSLIEALRPSKRKIGRPRQSWISQAKQDLERIGITPEDNFDNIFKIASDRDKWKALSNLHNSGQPLEG